MPAVSLAPTPILQFFNNLGAPNAGGTVLTQVGAVNFATYQDAAGTIPLPNPIPLNSRGEISSATGASQQLFLVNGVTYVFTIYDAAGNQIDQATYMAGIATAAAAGSSAPVTIAVLGDSLLAQQTMLTESPAYLLEQRFSKQGMNVKVIDCSYNGATFYRANNNAVFGAQTQVQYCIAQAPNIVIVSLGANDTINLVDNRNLAQVEADATTLFSALATGLPGAKICYASELWFDSTNLTAPGTTINNGWLLPIHMTLNAPGILANYWCPEVLTQDVHSLTLNAYGNAQLYSAAYGNWKSLDTYIQGLSTVATSFTVNWWRVCRMGGWSTDGQHPNRYGFILGLGYVTTGIRGSAWFSTLFPTAMTGTIAIWENPDSLFTQRFAPSGSAWTYTPTPTVTPQLSGGGGDVMILQSFFNQLDGMNWFYPYKMKVNIPGGNTNYDWTQPFTWEITDAPVNTLIYFSLDGAAWTSAIQNTDQNGRSIQASLVNNQPGWSVGAHNIRFSVGNIASPNLSFTITAANAAKTWTPTVVSSGGGTCSYTTQSGTYFYFGSFILFNLRIVLSSITSLNAGNIAITLPFTTNSGNQGYDSVPVFADALAAGVTAPIYGGTGPSSVNINLFKMVTGTATAVQKTDLTATSTFNITGMIEL